MKIRTITCHDVYNFGASLQAYALQHYLECQGHDVQIIHYKPDYLSRHFKLTQVDNPRFDKPFLRQLYVLAKLPGRLSSWGRKRAFDCFTSSYLHLTKRYNSYEELKADPPTADIYIAGSDQIWNTLFRNGRDAAFYLDFGSKYTKRISYAASFATSDVVPEYRDFVMQELRNFDFISIREKTSLPLLKTLGRSDGAPVCDPVFLLDKSEWLSLLEDNPLRSKHSSLISQQYILLYLSDNSKNIENTAMKLRKSTGWKIYAIGAVTAQYADENITNASPSDFLYFILNAQFIVSNSFHATAFSLIFGKKFCVVNRVEGINERMRSVLEDYNLQPRLVSSFHESLLSPIDEALVFSTTERIANSSKNWLNTHITSQ